MNPSLSFRLLDWFDAHKRPLPWRQAYDPYHVWVSEIMLQQTQMDRAVDYFTRFTARFPDLASLARADEEEVLRLWEGLGYYSRGRNLLKAARVVMESGGDLPRDQGALRALPGVGDYTAGAILSIAHNQPVPAVDANVTRVLARLEDIDRPLADPADKAFLRDLAASLIPEGRARDFNQALMELGALVCTPRNPGCESCPLGPDCLARSRGTAALRPVKPAPVKAVHIAVGTGVIVHRGLVFVQRRLPGGVWGGLWEFPGGQIEPGEEPRDAAVREVLEETGFAAQVLDKLAVIRHAYTRYRVTVHAYLLRVADDADPPPVPRLTEASTSRWAAREAVDALAFPSAYRKLVTTLETDPRMTPWKRRAGAAE